MKRKFLFAASAAIALYGAAPAVAVVLPNLTISALGDAGTSVNIGAVTAGDTLNFRAFDTAYLQNWGFSTLGYSYAVNPAGVQKTLGQTPGYPGTVGGTYGNVMFRGISVTYGSLVATLTGASGSVSAQVFPFVSSSPATPPDTLVFSGSLGGLFGSFTSEAKVLNFAVADADGGYGDNGGQFQIGSVPETATWLMIVTGFGMTGAALRRRRSAGNDLLA